MNLLKKGLLLLLMLAVCAGAAYGVEAAAWGREKKPAVVFEEWDLLEKVSAGLVYNQTYVQGGYLIIAGDDPWIGVPLEEGTALSRVRVRLGEPAEADFWLQVYYEGPAYELSEANSLWVSVPAGADTVDIELPEGEYTFLRFDFDAEFRLDGFTGGEYVEKEPEFTPNAVRMALVFAVLTALCLGGWVLIRRGKGKIVLAGLAVGILMAFLVEAGIWYASPASLEYTQEEVLFRLYPDMIGSMYNCEMDEDGAIVPTDTDPQVHFPTYGQTIRGILITLSEPAAERIPVQVYYGAEGYPYAPRHSVITSIAAGTKQVAVTLPELGYDLIRVDFDKTAPVESITASREPVEVSRVPFGVSWPRLVLFAAALAALTAFGLLRKEPESQELLPPNGKRTVSWAYAVFAAVVMLHHLYLLAVFPTVLTGVPWMNLPFLLFAAASVWRGKTWRDPGFRFFAVYWLYLVLRTLIPHPEELAAAEIPLMTGLYAIFGCYAAGRALPPEMRKGFLKAVCAIIITAMTLVCLSGFYVAWTDGELTTPGNSAIYLLKNRLYLIYHSSTSGNLVSVCAVTALFGMFLSRHKWAKSLYLLAALIMTLTNALTATRTGYLTIAAAVGMAVCIPLYERLSRNTVGKRSVLLALRNGLVIGIVFVILFAGLTFGQTYIVDGFNRVKLHGGVLIENALAEGTETAGTQLIHRDFSGYASLNALFSGRIRIWEHAVQNLLDNPEALVWGWSVVNPMEHGTNQSLVSGGQTFEHTHNLYLQTVLESGIVGLVLFLAGVLCFVICAVKLIRRREVPRWQKMLCLPAAAVLIEEFDECMVIFSRGYLPMMILYLFMGMTAACWAEEKKKQKALKGIKADVC